MKKIFMKKLKAFTLIELIVWISIILIFAIWIININFNYIWDKEKDIWLARQIISWIETVRNNALIWRWIQDWNNIFVPDQWKISLTPHTNSSDMMKIFYLTWTEFKEYNTFHIKEEKDIMINSLKRIVRNWSEIWNSIETTDTVDIIFEWKNASFSWVTNNYSILEITTKFNTISFNNINWVLEYKTWTWSLY